jgi:hypothetical protein
MSALRVLTWIWLRAGAQDRVPLARAFALARRGKFDNLPLVACDFAPINYVMIRPVSFRLEPDSIVNGSARHPVSIETADEFHLSGVF